MNEEIEEIFQGKITVDKKDIPISFMEYTGNSIDYIVYYNDGDTPCYSEDDEVVYSKNELEFNIYTKGNYLNIVKELKKILSSIVKCAKILSQKYDIVVTNPPYMSSKSMSTDLKKYINKNYPAGKSDLFAAFILRCIDFAKDDGYIGMITMQAFMFLSSYNELRRKILSYNIMSLLQVGYNSFPELNSQVAHAVTFTILKNTNNQKICGKYYNLNTNKVNDNKEKVFLERKESQFFLNTSCDFLKLPNNILAYWLTDNEKDILENAEKLESKMQIKQGLATGNNELFVRNWFEVDFNNIEFHAHDYKDFNNSKKLYAPYNKGGNFRKWYGNQLFTESMKLFL